MNSFILPSLHSKHASFVIWVKSTPGERGVRWEGERGEGNGHTINVRLFSPFLIFSVGRTSRVRFLELVIWLVDWEGETPWTKTIRIGGFLTWRQNGIHAVWAPATPRFFTCRSCWCWRLLVYEVLLSLCLFLRLPSSRAPSMRAGTIRCVLPIGSGTLTCLFCCTDRYPESA